jgi:hypothetical protein
LRRPRRYVELVIMSALMSFVGLDVSSTAQPSKPLFSTASM